MREVCHDVKVEPPLLPLATGNKTRGNTTDKARLDVSGVGVWGQHERTFIDVRIMHPNCDSYINKPIEEVYLDHENRKKNEYNERVIQVEKGTFTPVVMSIFGGMGKEAEKLNKRLATLIAKKKKERYADVLGYMRTRLRFNLLKSILITIRGCYMCVTLSHRCMIVNKCLDFCHETGDRGAVSYTHLTLPTICSV